MPASVTTSTRRRRLQRSTSSAAGRLVAVEEGHDPGPRGDLGRPQLAEPPGVLGGDHVGAGQRRAQRGRGVGGVADRGGGQHQRPRSPMPVRHIAV